MVSVDVLLITDQVHCKLVTVDGLYTCCISFLYAHNVVEKRKTLWRDLIAIHSTMGLPWLIYGDFNVVMSTSEKITPFGQLTIVSTELTDLCSATDLHDLRFVGQVFTWDNSHTYCKLDRVLGNGLWESAFPGTIVDFLPKSISDHTIAVLSPKFFMLLISNLKISRLKILISFLWWNGVLLGLCRVVQCSD